MKIMKRMKRMKELNAINSYIEKMNKDGEGLYFEGGSINNIYFFIEISTEKIYSPIVNIAGKSYEELKKDVTDSLIYIIKTGPTHADSRYPDYREITQVIRDTKTTIKRHAEQLKSEGDREELQKLREGINEHIEKLNEIKELIKADTEAEEAERFHILKSEAEEAEKNKNIKEIQETKPGTIYDITQETKRRIQAVKYQTTPSKEIKNLTEEATAYLKHTEEQQN